MMINKVWINTLGVNTEIWIDENGKGPILICSLVGKDISIGFLAEKIAVFIEDLPIKTRQTSKMSYLIPGERQIIYCNTHFIQKKYHSYGKGLYETHTDELIGSWENIKYLPLVLRALNEKINL